MKSRSIALMYLAAIGCVGDDVGDGAVDDAQLGRAEAALLPASPASATPVPADYDGDGFTDVALKGSNGIWYIDVAACNGGRCLGRDGFGARWDFAYPGYGGATAVPVPADYDHDGKADLAVKDASGMWGIDYASNGFGVFDVQVHGYGDASAVPVPADYDRDGKADLSVKNGAGEWYIDYASNGFGAWDTPSPFRGYGNAASVPVPADYDGDGKADLAVKTSAGDWFIDYAANGFGGWDAPSPFHGYGDATAVPVPADYDRDGKADLSVKNGAGEWYIDYAANGFGAWDAPSPFRGYGGSWSIATPGNYDNAGGLDLSVKDTGGSWYMDMASNGYAGWDTVPGTATNRIDNPNRVLVDTSAPWIESTVVYGPDGNAAPLVGGQYQLRIGVRYTVALRINPGNRQYKAGVELNPDLHVPTSLNVVNPVGSTGHVAITELHTRRFALTCSEWGSFPLGYMMRDVGAPDGTGNAFNLDYGIRVSCASAKPGLYGRVTSRATGDGIPGATVSTGSLTTTSDGNGNWSLPSASGGPRKVTVSKPGYSSTIAVNVRIPAAPAGSAGLELNTPLEEPFQALVLAGMGYTTYLDYSRGRTILHTVRVDSSYASVKLKKSSLDGSGLYKKLVQIAGEQGAGALAAINGGYFELHKTSDTRDDDAVGYFYARGYIPSLIDVVTSGPSYFAASGPPTVLEPSGTLPMLGISGIGNHQQFSIFHTEADFRSTHSDQWKQIGDPSLPIYDIAAPFNVSDVDYALQCGPTLLMNGAAIWRGNAQSELLYRMAWPRTAVGTKGSVMYLVVADGEGVNGGNGATFNQLGEFFRDQLQATTAMNFDGGESTEMVLGGANGPRVLNTLTSENSAAPDGYVPGGAVFNYLMVGQ